MNRYDEVQRLAYKLWEQEGRPNGRDQEHWFRAEMTVVQQPTAHETEVQSAPDHAVQKRAPRRTRKAG